MKLEWSAYRARTWESALVVVNSGLVFALGMALSTLGPLGVLAGSVVGGLGILRSFTLMHDLSHRSVFRSRAANDAVGVAASVLCLIPYHSWRRVHVDHHYWAGWRDIDPTEFGDIRDAPEGAKNLARFLWRYWIPLLGFIFALTVFWATKKQAARARSKGEAARIRWGARAVALAHVAAMLLAPRFYFVSYLPAFLVYLFVMEPLSISQHAEVPLRAAQPDARPVPQEQQEVFARTLRVPAWFGQHVLLGFHLHGAHHAYPWIPGYKLDRVPLTASTDEHWLAWLRRTKALPVDEVLRPHYQPGFAPR